ncbi:MAG: glutathione synthase [Myxococcota bacterium]
MRALYVMDPLSSLNLGGDSTFMLMKESTTRGWDVAWCTPGDLYAQDGRAHARAQRVATTPAGFATGEWGDGPLDDYDLVWMRKDPPFDMEYIFATYLLDMTRALVLNRPSAIRSLNEKLYAFLYRDLQPPTLVARDMNRLAAFAREHDRVVLKPWDGNGGRGVLVTSGTDPNLRAMLELLTGEGRRAILAQRYVPEIVKGDKRVILVDGEPVGAMLRVPSGADHRGNMHVGATVHATTLDDADRRICDSIGPRLVAEGLVFVGIDVIGGYLTEINVTSPTGIQEINRLDGVRIEAMVLDAAVRRLAEARA